MTRSLSRYFSYSRHTIAALALLGSTGCGILADTNRIVIAEMDGKSITREKLFTIIRDMPDDKRPNIRSKQDYKRVLNHYIDEEIKIPLGEDLAAEGKIEVPREMAREEYFHSILDEKERDTQRLMWNVPIPKPGEESDLMRTYELTPEAIQFQKDVIEQGTDRELERLLGERAVMFLATEAYQNKELTLDEDALRMEYDLSKNDFKTLERMTILGLQFPTAQEGSSAEASAVRQRLNDGESFDAILDSYLSKSMNYGIESVIENNPELDRFRGFWQEASGAQVGEIRGPVFMPEYARMKTNAQGQVEQAIVPECYLVFKVIEYAPESVRPFEEALPYVAPTVAFSEMMELLREQRGVKIFEDKLPTPQGGTSTMLSN